MSLGRITVRNPSAVRGKKFFFHAADGQNFAAQRDFAGHGQIAAHRNAGERADDGRADSDARRRAILGNGAFGHVHVNINVAIKILGQTEEWLRERT